MIARVYVLLPFSLSLKADDSFPPIATVFGAYTVKLYPPCSSAFDLADSTVPIVQRGHQLRPADSPILSNSIVMAGSPTVQANLLHLEFYKDTFNRTRRPVQPLPTEGDPSANTIEEVVNWFLLRLRTIIRGSDLRRVNLGLTPWRLRYLADDGAELPIDSALYREHHSWRVAIKANGVDLPTWTQLQALHPDFWPQPWDTLLLDAEAMLPEVGASIVLACTALEAFIRWLLDELATQHALSPALWRWVNKRSDRRQNPSVEERFDSLLVALAGTSLKDQKELWAAYLNLRKARNSFCHDGKAVDLNHQAVDHVAAQKMVQQAADIVSWGEALLPAARRRPPRSMSRVEIFVPIA